MTSSAEALLLNAATDLVRAVSDAACALPVAVLLSLILARKGQIKLCLDWAKVMAKLGLLCSFFWPLRLGCDFLLVAASLKAHGQSWEMPSLLAPAMLPLSTSFLLWLCALLPAILLLRVLPAYKDGEKAKGSRNPAIFFSVLTILLFFSARFCTFWPFSGLPEGMRLEEAVLAVFAHTWHGYYFSLLAAAIFVLAIPKPSFLHNEDEIVLTERACAILGLAGGLPHLLNVWGTVSGYLLRAPHLPSRLSGVLFSNVLLTLVLLLLLILATGKFKKLGRTIRILTISAFILFIFGSFLPALFSLH